MKYELIMSGIGGQGVMSAGELLCLAAVKKGYEVTFCPSYGQEKRGGRTMCQIVVSEETGSPVISQAQMLLIMDERSLNDYLHMLQSGGTLIINSSMVQSEINRLDISIVRTPLNELAKEIGNPKIANMVALGVMLKYCDIVSPQEAASALTEIFSGAKENLIEINNQALFTGYNL